MFNNEHLLIIKKNIHFTTYLFKMIDLILLDNLT